MIMRSKGLQFLWTNRGILRGACYILHMSLKSLAALHWRIWSQPLDVSWSASQSAGRADISGRMHRCFQARLGVSSALGAARGLAWTAHPHAHRLAAAGRQQVSPSDAMVVMHQGTGNVLFKRCLNLLPTLSPRIALMPRADDIHAMLTLLTALDAPQTAWARLGRQGHNCTSQLTRAAFAGPAAVVQAPAVPENRRIASSTAQRRLQPQRERPDASHRRGPAAGPGAMGAGHPTPVVRAQQGAGQADEVAHRRGPLGLRHGQARRQGFHVGLPARWPAGLPARPPASTGLVHT
jgi:hypothetical protein